MKARNIFSGKRPKNTGKDSTNRQVGHSSAVSPNAISSNRGQADTKAYKPKSSPATHRPTIKGKVDNRRVTGGGNG